jgi:hypothetical protein
MPDDVPGFAAQFAALGGPIAGPELGRWSFPPDPTRRVHFASPPVAVAAIPRSTDILALLGDGTISIGSLDNGNVRSAGSIGKPQYGDQRLDDVGGTLVVSPQSYLALAYVQARETLLLIDLRDSAKLIGGVQEGAAPVDAIAFDPAGGKLAVGRRGRGLAMIDIAAIPDSRPPTEMTEFTATDERFVAFAFSPDGRTLFAATDDRRIMLVDVQRPSKGNWESLSIDLPTIEAVAPGPKGFLLVAAGGGEWLAVDKEGITHGPWPVPARLVAGLPTEGPTPRPALGIDEEEPVVALLMGERLAVLHPQTGADLLADNSQSTHVALGFAQGFALLHGETANDVTAHPFMRPHAADVLT